MILSKISKLQLCGSLKLKKLTSPLPQTNRLWSLKMVEILSFRYHINPLRMATVFCSYCILSQLPTCQNGIIPPSWGLIFISQESVWSQVYVGPGIEEIRRHCMSLSSWEPKMVFLKKSLVALGVFQCSVHRHL